MYEGMSIASNSSLPCFSNYLLPFFGKTPLCQIRTCDIQQMLDSILSVKKPGHELCKKTKKDILAFLGMILDSAQEDGIVMNNPAKSKRLIIGGQAERIIPSWEEEEWTVLFYKVLPSLKLQQDRLFLLLDMFHGLRKSEIAALTWNNIDLEKGTINITTSVQWATVDGASNQGRIKEPKTQNGIREIVISQFVLPYLREANKSKTYLIYGTRYPAKTGDKPPSFSVLESIIGRIRTACEACGIKHKYRTHELRHTVITFDCNAGVDDKSLANNHGHFSAEFGKKQYARSLSTQRMRARKKTDDYLATLLQPKSIE